MNAVEMHARLTSASEELKDGHRLLEVRIQDAAEADRKWRMERAKAYTQTSGTVAERDAEVELATGQLRYAAKLSEDLRVAALEGVRSRRAVLSAFQTLTNLTREEANFARIGPDAA